jgi:hypothetical protein
MISYFWKLMGLLFDQISEKMWFSIEILADFLGRKE